MFNDKRYFEQNQKSKRPETFNGKKCLVSNPQEIDNKINDYFISFDPRIEAEAFRMVIINVPADNEMQQELVERLAQAKEYLDQILKA